MAETNQKQLEQLRSELNKAWQKLDLDQKIEQAATLEQQVAEPELWLDPENARQVNEKLAHLSNEVEPWKLLRTQLNDLDELLQLADSGLEEEVKEQIEILQDQLTELKNPSGLPENTTIIMQFCASRLALAVLKPWIGPVCLSACT